MGDIGLWTIAQATPDAVAVVEPGDKAVSYAELAAAADRIGRGLQEAGLRPGDSVAVLLPNGADMVAVYFAALQTGLYVVPLNWHLVAAEAAYILQDSGASAFVAHERFAATAVAAADAAGIPPSARYAVGDVPGGAQPEPGFGGGEHAQRVPGGAQPEPGFGGGEHAQRMSGGAQPEHAQRLSGFRPLAELGAGGSGRPAVRTAGAPMVYTSGTSGRPKGVRRPLTGADPDQVPPVTLWFFGLFGLKPFDGHVHLCGSPLYHTAVLNFVIISVQLGHTAVLMDGWQPEEMLRLIERHRVTHSHMVPTQFHRLLALPENVRTRYDLSSMRVMIHGAAPCPQETKRRMLDWWGPVVVEYYAASEGGGTLITAEDWLRKPGSVGRAWPGSAVRVLDEHGEERPANVPGQVYLQMGDSTFEYHHDAEKTRRTWVGKLFTVGDIGYLDDDGYLYLCDRGSDLIISGGVNIYPAEIESELACHPKVADVAVFGIPHDDWGEEIKAVVQPEAGVAPGPELTAELLAFLSGRVAKFKLPRTVDYVDELPRDPNGKLYKRRLRDPYWEGRARAI